eukprot:TCONS_00018381-protein
MKIDNTCINRLVYDFEDRPTILLYVLEREKDHSIVEYLVNHEYCDVNVIDWRGQSPFYFAVQLENIPAVKCLLKRDPSVINKTTYHSSPLHRAARSGNVDLVKILLEQDNINVNIKDYYKETADQQEHVTQEIKNLIIKRREKKK